MASTISTLPTEPPDLPKILPCSHVPHTATDRKEMLHRLDEHIKRLEGRIQWVEEVIHAHTITAYNELLQSKTPSVPTNLQTHIEALKTYRAEINAIYAPFVHDNPKRIARLDQLDGTIAALESQLNACQALLTPPVRGTLPARPLQDTPKELSRLEKEVSICARLVLKDRPLPDPQSLGVITTKLHHVLHGNQDSGIAARTIRCYLKAIKLEHQVAFRATSRAINKQLNLPAIKPPRTTAAATAYFEKLRTRLHDLTRALPTTEPTRQLQEQRLDFFAAAIQSAAERVWHLTSSERTLFQRLTASSTIPSLTSPAEYGRMEQLVTKLLAIDANDPRRDDDRTISAQKRTRQEQIAKGVECLRFYASRFYAYDIPLAATFRTQHADLIAAVSKQLYGTIKRPPGTTDYLESVRLCNDRLDDAAQRLPQNPHQAVYWLDCASLELRHMRATYGVQNRLLEDIHTFEARFDALAKQIKVPSETLTALISAEQWNRAVFICIRLERPFQSPSEVPARVEAIHALVTTLRSIKSFSGDELTRIHMLIPVIAAQVASFGLSPAELAPIDSAYRELHELTAFNPTLADVSPARIITKYLGDVKRRITQACGQRKPADIMKGLTKLGEDLDAAGATFATADKSLHDINSIERLIFLERGRLQFSQGILDNKIMPPAADIATRMEQLRTSPLLPLSTDERLFLQRLVLPQVYCIVRDPAWPSIKGTAALLLQLDPKQLPDPCTKFLELAAKHLGEEYNTLPIRKLPDREPLPTNLATVFEAVTRAEIYVREGRITPERALAILIAAAGVLITSAPSGEHAFVKAYVACGLLVGTLRDPRVAPYLEYGGVTALETQLTEAKAIFDTAYTKTPDDIVQDYVQQPSDAPGTLVRAAPPPARQGVIIAELDALLADLKQQAQPPPPPAPSHPPAPPRIMITPPSPTPLRRPPAQPLELSRQEATLAQLTEQATQGQLRPAAAEALLAQIREIREPLNFGQREPSPLLARLILLEKQAELLCSPTYRSVRALIAQSEQLTRPDSLEDLAATVVRECHAIVAARTSDPNGADAALALLHELFDSALEKSASSPTNDFLRQCALDALRNPDASSPLEPTLTPHPEGIMMSEMWRTAAERIQDGETDIHPQQFVTDIGRMYCTIESPTARSTRGHCSPEATEVTCLALDKTIEDALTAALPPGIPPHEAIPSLRYQIESLTNQTLDALPWGDLLALYTPAGFFATEPTSSPYTVHIADSKVCIWRIDTYLICPPGEPDAVIGYDSVLQQIDIDLTRLDHNYLLTADSQTYRSQTHGFCSSLNDIRWPPGPLPAKPPPSLQALQDTLRSIHDDLAEAHANMEAASRLESNLESNLGTVAVDLEDAASELQALRATYLFGPAAKALATCEHSFDAIWSRYLVLRPELQPLILRRLQELVYDIESDMMQAEAAAADEYLSRLNALNEQLLTLPLAAESRRLYTTALQEFAKAIHGCTFFGKPPPDLYPSPLKHMKDFRERLPDIAQAICNAIPHLGLKEPFYSELARDTEAAFGLPVTFAVAVLEPKPLAEQKRLAAAASNDIMNAIGQGDLANAAIALFANEEVTNLLLLAREALVAAVKAAYAVRPQTPTAIALMYLFEPTESSLPPRHQLPDSFLDEGLPPLVRALLKRVEAQAPEEPAPVVADVRDPQKLRSTLDDIERDIRTLSSKRRYDPKRMVAITEGIRTTDIALRALLRQGSDRFELANRRRDAVEKCVELAQARLPHNREATALMSALVKPLAKPLAKPSSTSLPAPSGRTTYKALLAIVTHAICMRKLDPTTTAYDPSHLKRALAYLETHSNKAPDSNEIIENLRDLLNS